MIVSSLVSPLWQDLPQDHAKRLERAVALGLEAASGGTATVFFRADDVAVPGNSFARMAEVFVRTGAPLCMAVVPAWLTANRWQTLSQLCDGTQWCWCQHGWRHMNFEAPGVKKREFGSARPAKDKRQDLAKGFKRLSDIMGKHFTPVFSPPWNRCDGESMAAMPALGFTGLSRTVGAGPEPPQGLPDFPVCTDLHTRKEPDPSQSLDALLEELTRGLASGQCGVMLHHQRMNETSALFLETLVAALGKHPGVRFSHYRELLGQ